ncbi:MAG: hypothetical protein M3R00_09055, partial [Pseudomonadota bacterium]|nr:hypothetical protein [Pseudomonadota bacterium]
AEGNRVILEYFFKANFRRGGHKNIEEDTWFASKALKFAFTDPKSLREKDWYSHDVVIYGYDDNMTVRNENGETQTGVFYVRNSWGESAPEYMTYDFFKLMALEGTSINTAKKLN